MALNSVSPGILSLEDFPAFLETQKGLARYSSSAEKKPNHLWYQIDKVQIDALLKQFKQAFLDLLKGSPEDDKELQHLIRNVDTVANVLRSPPVKVALLGAQGAGKSLITNAIFDCDGLSLTGADGAACTSSVTKYVDYPSEVTSVSRFLAEIKFLDASNRESLLEEHARSYYQYQHADDDSDGEEPPISKRKQRVSDDLMDIRLKDTALDVFTTLFGSREAFEAQWSKEAYRRKEFVRICKLKCEEVLQNEGPDRNGIVLKSARDQQSLSDQIKPFLTKVPDVNCLWPLVDSVTVHFSNDLLRAGLEFIDLPGWGDLNLSRARHVEKINDNVDVVIVLTDTIRITSEDKLVNTIRQAVSRHGASKVKIVATKIDAISKNQLSQYAGGIYDVIKQLENIADDQESLLDDDDTDQGLRKKVMIAKDKSYLTRATLQAKITSRMESIANEFAAKLQCRNTKDLPQVFHTSASEYMDWIKQTRINFKDQPSIPVEMTGIPAVRYFLYTLPADQNLQDHENHIHNLLPAFVDRIERTVSETNRNGGFICIAEDFQKVREPFMTNQLASAKSLFQSASDASIAKIMPELNNDKCSIRDHINKHWLTLRAAAFNRVVKNRGTVPKGLSRAKGLEGGADWNRDLATILSPTFDNWI
ncbi:hypothetical protein E8E13_002622 [Curvularia kusanoi]|uniref:Uncharacterized protein n=1 Tax=Curvularia kusanoi TaxID=90978 RepID=A0A9P4T768_CURKU|nr:hypothetical protein E8E13_002622 [Curvularia kusanoi]